jgi:hypothetical protein
MDLSGQSKIPTFEGQSFNIEPYGENERKNSQKLEI